MTIAQEEIFGPVVAVIPYGDEAEAIAIANDSAYGLSGSVWSDDDEHARRLAARIRTGNVGVNQFDARHRRAVRRLQAVRPRPGVRAGGHRRVRRAAAADRPAASARRLVAAPDVLEQRASRPSPARPRSRRRRGRSRRAARATRARSGYSRGSPRRARTSSGGRLPATSATAAATAARRGSSSSSSASARKTFVCSSKRRPIWAARPPGRRTVRGSSHRTPSVNSREPGRRALEQVGARREVAIHGPQRHAGRLRHLRVRDRVRMVVLQQALERAHDQLAREVGLLVAQRGPALVVVAHRPHYPLLTRP